MLSNTKTLEKGNGRMQGNQDFIETWIELLDNLTDANRELKEAAGLFVLSSLVGHKAVIPVTTDAKIFSEGMNMTGKRLNLWFLIIGKSRWSRKSTVSAYAEDYLRVLMGDEYILSTIATPEALIEELSENNLTKKDNKK